MSFDVVDGAVTFKEECSTTSGEFEFDQTSVTPEVLPSSSSPSEMEVGSVSSCSA